MSHKPYMLRKKPRTVPYHEIFGVERRKYGYNYDNDKEEYVEGKDYFTEEEFYE